MLSKVPNELAAADVTAHGGGSGGGGSLGQGAGWRWRAPAIRGPQRSSCKVASCALLWDPAVCRVFILTRLHRLPSPGCGESRRRRVGGRGTRGSRVSRGPRPPGARLQRAGARARRGQAQGRCAVAVRAVGRLVARKALPSVARPSPG